MKYLADQPDFLLVVYKLQLSSKLNKKAIPRLENGFTPR